MKGIEPKAGQESVWDYSRPPKIERTNKHLKIILGGEMIAETNRAFRVLETSHPAGLLFSAGRCANGIPDAEFEFEFLQMERSRRLLRNQGRRRAR
jgi:hypothetical protein